MKKLMGVLLSLLLILPTLPVGAVEKSAGLTENQVVELMGALEILQGDENGNLKLDALVTRAQFVKMAVAASVYKDDADVKLSVSLFPDVSASHWAAGYIRVGVNSGWIKGYLDGSFRPDETVRLEEAVTIVLKLLGYTDADFIGSYPDGQLAKYRSLKLNTGIDALQGQKLTRRECMNLVYNTLCTYTKNGVPYGQTLGYTPDSDGNLDYNAFIESKKKGPYIVTGSDWQEILGLGDGVICYKDGKEISASEVAPFDVLYYTAEFSKVWVYDDKTAGVIEAFSPDKSHPTGVTVSGTSYTVAKKSDYAGNLSGGAFDVDDPVILLLGEKGEAVEALPAVSPFLAEKASDIGEPLTLYRNGVKADSSEFTDTVLVYYNKETGLALTYDKNVSGLVGTLLPNKENPTSITIGNTALELSNAVKDLFKNESTFGENDFITVYLGSSGRIEYAQQADIYDTDLYDENGISYDSLLAQTLKGPEIVSGDSWKQKLGFDAETAEVYLNGKKVSSAVIKDYDVVYYSNAFKTLWIYSDRVTGVLEKISPSAVAPSSVTVAGTDYAIETSAAAIQFSGKGPFAPGNTVTLLLGKNGGVVAAVEPDAVSAVVFGLSTDVSKKEYTLDGKTYEGYYVTVSSFDGGVYSIRTDDKDFDTGVMVMITTQNGVQTVKEYTGRYNSVSDLVSAVKADRIAADAVLVDCYKKSFITTYPTRLKEISLTTKNVTYYNFDEDGKLDYLVLNDATGDLHSYGVVMNVKGSYVFNTSAKNNSISSYIIPPVGAVQVRYNGTEADDIAALSEITVTAMADDGVWAGAKKYKLWDYAECFVMEQRGFSVAKDSDDSLKDVISQSSVEYMRTAAQDAGYTLRAFCDDSGIVRVLIAQKKI